MCQVLNLSMGAREGKNERKRARKQPALCLQGGQCLPSGEPEHKSIDIRKCGIVHPRTPHSFACGRAFLLLLIRGRPHQVLSVPELETQGFAPRWVILNKPLSRGPERRRQATRGAVLL